MKAVFENQHFIAVDKPPGWLTIPGREPASDQRPCLSREVSKSGKALVVHRLDAEVSGLVLFARDAAAHRAANSWFEGRLVCKTYEALTEGSPTGEWRPGQAFEWTSRLLRGKKRAYESDRGKESVTRAIWLGEKKGAQRWRLEPRTGRAHQLRFELARHGFPILGDGLYGSTRSFEREGIALRAVELDFGKCPDAAALGLPEKLRLRGLWEEEDGD
jgi:tRNA pseudouridine32 synthase/23S rRNA pseudouridine746 synthase